MIRIYKIFLLLRSSKSTFHDRYIQDLPHSLGVIASRSTGSSKVVRLLCMWIRSVEFYVSKTPLRPHPFVKSKQHAKEKPSLGLGLRDRTW